VGGATRHDATTAGAGLRHQNAICHVVGKDMPLVGEGLGRGASGDFARYCWQTWVRGRLARMRARRPRTQDAAKGGLPAVSLQQPCDRHRVVSARPQLETVALSDIAHYRARAKGQRGSERRKEPCVDDGAAINNPSTRPRTNQTTRPKTSGTRRCRRLSISGLITIATNTEA
jgi:hypothetical protein